MSDETVLMKSSYARHAAAHIAPARRLLNRAMAKKWLIAILVLTFAFVLMPFLLWYMTTFTRPFPMRTWAPILPTPCIHGALSTPFPRSLTGS